MRPTTLKSRDTLIRETTDRLLGDWIAELNAGSARAISDLQNTVLERLTEDNAKALFVLAATNPAGADAAFVALVGKVMTDHCAADAERIADFVLNDLVDESTDDRISRAIDAQAA